MLTAQDLRGLYAIIPTPARPGSERLDATDTVDLAESERVVNALIDDGIAGLIVLGTTGECATLSHADYEAFVTCVLETVNRRIPTFIGTSALGGHEVARRLRFIRERGADGTLLGLPMWQPVVDQEAVDFYRQVYECFPDIAIMVYANSRAFRYAFPVEFWRQIARDVPTVCAAKHSRPAHLTDLIEASQGRIKFMPHEMSVHKFYELSPETTTACWATSAAMGPAPARAIIEAILAKNSAGIDTLAAAIGWASSPIHGVVADPAVMASYNIQLEKIRINAAGYCQSGPMRPPYNYMPDDFREAAEECGRRWARLCETYLGDYRFSEQVWLAT
ncbi:MAG: dihydrodipicolinate synthase family protein [Proteobacteria bacterium]|nr:dihydrodipicolinate synthase family protein [Pseudomonadota bacterium]